MLSPHRYTGSKLISFPISSVQSNTLCCMSYNIAFCAGIDNLLGRVKSKELVLTNLEHIVATIKQASPDIVAIQELDRASYRSHGIDQLDYIAKQCGYAYVAWAVTWNKSWVPYPRDASIFQQYGYIYAGQAIFSRYPIVKQLCYTFAKDQDRPFYEKPFYINRIIQYISCKVKGKLLHIAHVHLEAFDEASRCRQIQVLSSYIKQHPVDVLMGDFNTDHQATLNTLSLADTAILHPRSSRPTFPSHQPNQVLDHIFFDTDNLNCISSEVLEPSHLASDHLPVMATFSL